MRRLPKTAQAETAGGVSFMESAGADIEG
jgi:hypothetical protein